jgi:taurine dioxygenase
MGRSEFMNKDFRASEHDLPSGAAGSPGVEAMTTKDRKGRPMRSNKLTSHFGLEVEDFDIKSLATDQDWDGFLRMIYENQLLIVRDQDLTAADIVKINKRLGKPNVQVPKQYCLGDYPEIFVISNIIENGRAIGSTSNGFGWHSDMIYGPTPTALTALYMVEACKQGGATIFANLYAAYEALPQEEREMLDNVGIEHSYAYTYAKRKNAPPLPEEAKTLYPDVVHPLVRAHPYTGRKGFFFGQLSARNVVGIDTDDTAFIERISKHMVSDQFTYEHFSRDHDLMIWDNRGLMHTATPYDVKTDRRLVYRIVTLDETIASAAA